MMALFAYFQGTNSKLDGPLSTAVPVPTIRAANKEVKLVLDLSSMADPQRGRTLRWPSDAMLIP